MPVDARAAEIVALLNRINDLLIEFTAISSAERQAVVKAELEAVTGQTETGRAQLSEPTPGALDSFWVKPEMAPLTQIRYAAAYFDLLVPQGTFSICINFSTAPIVAYSAPKVRAR